MKREQGKLYLAAAFILAGSSVVAARYVAEDIGPFATTFASLVFAVLTALLLYGRQTIKAAKSVNPRHWRILALQAVFGIFLFRVFLTFALRFTSAAEAGVITGASPAITALFARVLLRERLRLRSLIGILCTFAGLLLLQGIPFHMTAFDKGHLTGNLLALGAAACEALFTTLSRKAHTDREEFTLHPVAQAGIVSTLALALCTVPMLLEGSYPALAQLPAGGWVALAWYGSIVTVAAFSCMFTGTKTCDGYTIATFSGLIPVSALALSILVLGEPVLADQWAGCAFIVLAVFIMNRPGPSGESNAVENG